MIYYLVIFKDNNYVIQKNAFVYSHQYLAKLLMIKLKNKSANDEVGEIKSIKKYLLLDSKRK